MARLSRTGLSPNAAAITGSAVAIAVESRFSMNSAQATISGISMAPGSGEARSTLGPIRSIAGTSACRTST
jgi:hypothetical protein